MLVKGGTLLLGENLEVKNKDLRIVNGSITEIANNLLPMQGEEIFNATHFLISPGFINAHFHPTHSVSKGIVDGYNWDTGLSVLYHVDVKKSDDDRYWTSLLGFSQTLLSGVTSTAVLTSNIVGEAKAAKKLGLRTFLAKSYSDVYLKDGPAPRMMTIDEIRKDFEKMHVEYTDDLCQIFFGLSTDLGVSDELFQLATELSIKHQTRVHMHSCEMRSLIRQFQNDRGKHPILHYRDIGFLSDRVMLVHMTQIDRADVLEVLQQSGAHIVHCPVANAKLADGILPLSETQKRGINIAFGTDADINNNSSNILSDMKSAVLLHASHQHKADALSHLDVLKMATVNGAKALGRQDLGSIDVGKKADLVFFNTHTMAFTPTYDYRSNLVFNAPDIRPQHVMVEGRWGVSDYALTNADISESYTHVHQLSHVIKENLVSAPKPLTQKKVYISGALTGVEDQSLKTFYEHLAKVAEDLGMKSYVAHIHGTDPIKNPDVSPEDVYQKDIDAVLEADIFVAYVGAKSIGTGMEVMLAKLHQRLMILLYEKGAIVTRLVRGAVTPECHIVFESREEALNSLRVKLEKMVK